MQFLFRNLAATLLDMRLYLPIVYALNPKHVFVDQKNNVKILLSAEMFNQFS